MPMSAGFIFYRPAGDDLAGVWSHENIAGQLGSERVHGASLGSLPGTYPVEIFKEPGLLFYAGELSVEPLGRCYRLSWKGKLTETDQQMDFVGIGYIVDELLVATFEPDLSGDADESSA